MTCPPDYDDLEIINKEDIPKDNGEEVIYVIKDLLENGYKMNSLDVKFDYNHLNVHIKSKRPGFFNRVLSKIWSIIM